VGRIVVSMGVVLVGSVRVRVGAGRVKVFVTVRFVGPVGMNVVVMGIVVRMRVDVALGCVAMPVFVPFAQMQSDAGRDEDAR
jgi:hypothetical protein